MGWNQPCLEHIYGATTMKQMHASLPARTHIRALSVAWYKSFKNERKAVVKNSVVILPDCRSKYNDASLLPRESNITLFTAPLCPKKRLEKRPVSLANDGSWIQSDGNARSNYQRGNMQRPGHSEWNGSPLYALCCVLTANGDVERHIKSTDCCGKGLWLVYKSRYYIGRYEYFACWGGVKTWHQNM